MKKKILPLIIVSTLLFVLSLIILSFSSSFFAYWYPVKSETIIIEAWVPTFEIEQALDFINSDLIDRVIITGNSYPEDENHIMSAAETRLDTPGFASESDRSGFWLFTNSSLVINPEILPVTDEFSDTLFISIRLKGSEAAGHFAHFNLVFNGVIAGSAFSSPIDSVYFFEVPAPKSSPKTLIIHFDNDLMHQKQDRNLCVISIITDSGEILINPGNAFIIKDAGVNANGFKSQSDEVKNYLSDLGINSTKITTISFEPVIRNQTLAAAKAITKQQLFSPITSANILSSGLHSRRSWFTYRKILGENIPIGVIFFQQADYHKGILESTFSKKIRLIDESVSYVLNWIYLTFFY